MILCNKITEPTGASHSRNIGEACKPMKESELDSHTISGMNLGKRRSSEI